MLEQFEGPPLTATEQRRLKIESGSPLAHVLHRMYSGQPVTLVDSPPGAGKSTLVSQVVSYLYRNTDLDVTVVVSTNAQGSDLSARLADELHDLRGENGLVPLVVSGSRMRTPQTAYGVAPANLPVITVRTLASCKQSPPQCDVMVFDEFYQMTFADYADAADNAEMVLGVGDPGQIGPVIAFDTNAWEHMHSAPHRRAPEVLRRRADCTVVELESTYRLGPVSTNVIAPLYGFPFASTRPERFLDIFDGEIAALEVPERDDAYDLDTMRAIMERARDYLDAEVTEKGRDGELSTRRITQEDICIIVSRNVQVSALEALAVEFGFTVGELTIGTADRLQGGQWHCVIAVDPTLAGAESDHALSSGRLCVMASRHMTHMTWVYDAGWPEVMRTTPHRDDARRGGLVRERILRVGL